MKVPTIMTTSIAVSDCTKSGYERATMYTPAFTMVAAWIRALTGVGPSMASGSHTCSGNWALLPTAPTKSSRQIQVMVPDATSPLSACSNTPANCSVEKVTKIRNMPSVKPKSPTRLTRKAFLPAWLALFLGNQNAIRRYEQRPTPSQPRKTSR